MKETNAVITSVLWTGKNPKEIERFCNLMELDSFFIEGSEMWVRFTSPEFTIKEGHLIEAIKGYGIIKISKVELK